MKTSSSRQMAVYIALITSFVCGLVELFVLDFTNHNFILILIFSILFAFITVYVITYSMLNGFIFEKINPIYKTIYNLNFSEKNLRKQMEEKDIVKEMNKDVMDWAKNKAKEIAQLKQMEKYRKEFLGNVSHELKTPIFNIQGYILTLLDGGLEDESINKLYLEKTEKSINRMISIVKDLEVISQLESGELKLVQEKFDIIKLVEEIFEMNEMSAKKKNISLEFSQKYEKPLIVFADKKRIIDVLNNLVRNSIIYGKENGKTTISFLDMRDRVLIEISDDGIGISEKDIPRLFERFYRVDKSRSRDQGGTGLGLAIVKHVMEAHKQTVNVRSTLEEGTTFSFTLNKTEPAS